MDTGSWNVLMVNMQPKAVVPPSLVVPILDISAQFPKSASLKVGAVEGNKLGETDGGIEG